MYHCCLVSVAQFGVLGTGFNDWLQLINEQEIQFTTVLLEKFHHIKLSFVKQNVQRVCPIYIITIRKKKVCVMWFQCKQKKNDDVFERVSEIQKQIEVRNISYNLTEFIGIVFGVLAKRSSFGNGWWTDNNKRIIKQNKTPKNTLGEKNCVYTAEGNE